MPVGSTFAWFTDSVTSSGNSYSTTVVLDGCTRINCGTRTYGSQSTLIVK